MHNLQSVTALGGYKPRIDRYDHVTIAENDDWALASIAARLRFEDQCLTNVKDFLGTAPSPGKTVSHGSRMGFWMGPDQWMIGAPKSSHEQLANDLRSRFAQTASVTEQTGAWVCFDLTGSGIADMMERLCPVPIRKMSVGDARRGLIHQLGCFVIKHDNILRLLGPRASAGSLHHALTVAARSTA